MKPEAEKPSITQTKAGKWYPPEPEPDDFDWIRHKKGEWYKGEIDLIKYNTIKFDSDELGDLEFDFNDILELRSPKLNYCQFDGDLTRVGTLHIRDNEVLMGGEEVQRFDRSELVTVLPGAPTERNFWTGKISIGGSRQSGNTDQTSSNGSLYLERRTLITLVGLNYAANYGELDGEENVNNHRLVGTFQVFLTDKLYVTPAAAEFYKDPFQNIEYRLTPASGMGYYIFDRGDLRWNVDVLVGNQFTKYDSVGIEEDLRDSTAAGIARSNLDMDITKDVDFELGYSLTYPMQRGTSAIHHTSAGLSIDLNDTLDLDLTFVWDRVGKPERDSSGVLPDKNDFQFTLALGIEF